MQNAKKLNHAYLKKDTGALGYLFYAYWATSGDERVDREGYMETIYLIVERYTHFFS